MIGMQATTLPQFAASWLLKAHCWQLSIGFAFFYLQLREMPLLLPFTNPLDCDIDPNNDIYNKTCQNTHRHEFLMFLILNIQNYHIPTCQKRWNP
jgi:hypothetical protein